MQRDRDESRFCVVIRWRIPSQDQVIARRADVLEPAGVDQDFVDVFASKISLRQSLLVQHVGQLVVLGPRLLRIDAELA